MSNLSVRTFALFALMPILACGADGAELGPEHEDPAEHACEHVGEEGPKLRAVAERGVSAPELELGGEPVTIELRDDEPGYVRVEVEEDTAVILFASAENVVTGLYHEDEEEELDSAGANEYCEEDIPEHFDLDLHEPGTYYLRLGPSVLPEIWIMLTEAEGHSH